MLSARCQKKLRTFTLIEHTADVGIVATGETFAEALSSVAEGMVSVLVEPEDTRCDEVLQVTVVSADREALVVDWLNELLYRFEAEAFLPQNFEVVVDEVGTTLRAVCRGERVDPERHNVLTCVKAATYHGLEVTDEGSWRIQVFLDV